MLVKKVRVFILKNCLYIKVVFPFMYKKNKEKN